MLDINCKKCGCLVAKLEKGSSVKPGAVFLCEPCYKLITDKPDLRPPDFIREFLGGFGK